jgi:hypothetical protein
MSAVLDTITDLSNPAEAAVEIQRLNDQLAAERTIPPAIAAAVREIAGGIEDTNLRRWETVDPTHAVIVLRSAVSAQRALQDPDSPVARDQLRVALESIRRRWRDRRAQAVSAEHPETDRAVAGGHTRTRRRLADPAASARALSAGIDGRGSRPEATARPVRLVARIVNLLRFAR